MNLLARAKLSARRLVFYSPSSTNRLFHLQPISALHHCDFYSTKAAKPRTTQKSPQKSSSFEQTINKKAAVPSSVWPKPQLIPYQASVANIVNLIGNVTIPVKSMNYSDGRPFTAFVISLEGSLSIPVVFEGDLAHVVASHVKVKDCVFVSGQLSVDPLRCEMMGESVGKFHVVAENINFVVGFERSGFDRKLGFSSPAVEVDELGKFRSKNVEEKLDSSNVDTPAVNLYGAKTLPQSDVVDKGKVVSPPQNVGSWKKDADEVDELGKFRSKNVEEKLDSSNVDTPAVNLYGAETLPQSDVVDKGKVVSSPQNVGSPKKDANEILDMWTHLFKNPLQWYDYRGHKANGLVKEKFPDFKQKETGEPLWINTVPKWLLPELPKLKFDVKEMTMKIGFGGEGHSDRKQNAFVENTVKNLKEKEHSGGKQKSDPEDSWKNLVENPEKWWDNRAKKRNPKFPDFRHKETGEVLWLNTSPQWALSKLPPVRGGQGSA